MPSDWIRVISRDFSRHIRLCNFTGHNTDNTMSDEHACTMITWHKHAHNDSYATDAWEPFRLKTRYTRRTAFSAFLFVWVRRFSIRATTTCQPFYEWHVMTFMGVTSSSCIIQVPVPVSPETQTLVPKWRTIRFWRKSVKELTVSCGRLNTYRYLPWKITPRLCELIDGRLRGAEESTFEETGRWNPQHGTEVTWGDVMRDAVVHLRFREIKTLQECDESFYVRQSRYSIF